MIGVSKGEGSPREALGQGPLRERFRVRRDRR